MDHLTLNVALNGALGESDTQTVELIPCGNHPHQLGLQVIDDAALNRIHADLVLRNQDIPIDYNHGSLFGNHSGDVGKAAGWIKPNTATVTESGLSVDIKWTPRAAEYIRNAEYKYLSPVFLYDPKKSGNRTLFVSRLVNAGLTNMPNITTMQPLSNSKLNNDTSTEEKGMELLNALIGSLKLAPDSTADAVVTAVNSLTAELDENKKAVTEMYGSLAVNSLLDANRKIMELNRPPAVSPDELLLLQNRLAELEKTEANTLVANAITAGKIAPSQESWAKDYATKDRAGFEAFLVNALAVPLAESVTGGGMAANSKALPDLDKSIMGQLSVTEDDIAKLDKN